MLRILNEGFSEIKKTLKCAFSENKSVLYEFMPKKIQNMVIDAFLATVSHCI